MGKAVVNDSLFLPPLSAVSHLNEQSLSLFFFFAAVTAMNILTLFASLSLSSCSVSWSSKPASQGKTSASRAPGFAPVQPQQLSRRNVASGVFFKNVFTHQNISIAPSAVRPPCHQNRISIFSTELINPMLDFLDQYSNTNFRDYCYLNLPRVAMQLFNHVLINYLECTLPINAAKLYWLSRNSGILRCQSIKRVKFLCFALLHHSSFDRGKPCFSVPVAIRCSLNVSREGESDLLLRALNQWRFCFRSLRQLHWPGLGRPGWPSQGLVPTAPWECQAE